MKVATTTLTTVYSYTLDNLTGTSTIRGMYLVKSYPDSATSGDILACS